MKYAVHPGWILSGDGDKHYIRYTQLMKLYKVPFDKCICWDDNDNNTYLGRSYNDYIHLYPQSNGNYTLDK